jgi:hypothetical protein
LGFHSFNIGLNSEHLPEYHYCMFIHCYLYLVFDIPCCSIMQRAFFILFSLADTSSVFSIRTARLWCTISTKPRHTKAFRFKGYSAPFAEVAVYH